MEFVRDFFSFICGQVHTWSVRGVPLPFCQRCTGLYIGGFYAIVLILLFRPRPTQTCLWIHGAFLLVMAPFGYHLVQQNELGRTITGQLFGAGLAYFLILSPADMLPRAPRFLVRSEWMYFTGLSIGVPILLLVLRFGGPLVYATLAFCGLLAAMAFALLCLTNLGIVGTQVWIHLRLRSGVL